MKRLLSLLPALAAFATALLIAATATVAQTTECKKPSNAQLQYTGKRHAFTLCLVPGVWETKASQNPSMEVLFIHKDGDVFAAVFSERYQTTPEILKRILLNNVREAGQKPIKVVSDTKCVVKGEEMTRLIISGSSKWGSPMTWYCQLYAGKEGSFQVLTWCPSNAFDDVRSDLEDFLNGFEVTAKPA